MNKIRLVTLSLIVILLTVLGVGIANANTKIDAAHAAPAGGHTFSSVIEGSPDGDIERDLKNNEEALRAMGFTDEEIQEQQAHLRANLEKKKYGVAETKTFSVVIDNTMPDPYAAFAQALEAQGFSQETAQILTDDLRKETASQTAQSVKSNTPWKRRIDGAVAYNGFGQMLYKYSSGIYWEYNGSKITALDTWESHSTYWGWQFQGSTHNSSGGVGQWSYTLHREATMFQPILGLTAHPDTHQRVYGDGTSWGTASP